MSQKNSILQALRDGQRITPLQALSQFGCLTISQRCTELRREGHDVRSRMVKVGNKHVAEYFLAKQEELAL